MICIFSFRRDSTTTVVMRWLKHLGAVDVVRVNSDEFEDDEILEFDSSEDLSFRHGGRLITLSEISAVWYRKGRHWLCARLDTISAPDHPRLEAHILARLRSEQIKLSEYLHHLIEAHTRALGSAQKCDLNKLLILNLAKKSGLSVPAFVVASGKQALMKAVSSKDYITKPLADVIYVFDAEHANMGYFSYTEEITSSDLTELPSRISPSFVQEKVHKAFDVRVFYLEGVCSAMAIFSQSDKQTQVDFRRYNLKKPNRAVPVTLQSSLEVSLRTLFTELGLNNGSADFVVDRQGHFFFLEINPVGQFSMVSEPCNYYLEKRVAETLLRYANESRPQ